MKKIFLSLALACPLLANVCTPLNYPATGPFPAIINGIGRVGRGTDQIMWTSDLSPSAPNSWRIEYATAAQWAASPGTYPQIHYVNPTFSVSNSSQIQGDVLANLTASTTYHVIGQSLQGGTWCTATDETFTTTANTPTLPTVPPVVSGTVPTINGTDYIYGVSCGTSGTVGARLQDCVTTATPGAGVNNTYNGVGIPPGVYNYAPFYFPANPNSVQVTCSSSTSICTQTGTAPANGTQIQFAKYFGSVPTPLVVGATFRVINSGTGGAGNFQVSYDGSTVITLTSTQTCRYMVWPPLNSGIVIHSTAPASSLPPPGVRLDQIAYKNYLVQLQDNEFSSPSGGPQYTEFTSNVYWTGILFTVDPAATAACSNCVDPVPFIVPYATNAYNYNIVWNQSAANWLPPNRTEILQADCQNCAFYNSDIRGLDYWKPFRTIPVPTVTTNTVSYSAGIYSWVNSSGTKSQCSYAGGSFTLSGTGSYVDYIDPTNCQLVVQVQTGASGTGSNATITTVASPASPTYTYTSPASQTYNGYNALNMGSGSVSSGVISYADAYSISASPSVSESGIGLNTGPGPGPLTVVNNYIDCAGVCGVFSSDSFGASYYQKGNITEIRNSIGTDSTHWYFGSNWNGGNYFFRNLDEVKQGVNVYQDGNIYGPYFSQIAPGECVIHEINSALFNYTIGVPNYADDSNWTFTNNTCYNTASGISQLSLVGSAPPFQFQNGVIRNNLFYQPYGYSRSFPPGTPLSNIYAQTQSSSSCSDGRLTEWATNSENLIWDHNVGFVLGGCQPWFWGQFGALSSYVSMTNSILPLSQDTPGPYGGNTSGTGFLSYQAISGAPTDTPNCASFTGSALFACFSDWHVPATNGQSGWSANVLLGFWSNPFPGATVDLTSMQVATMVGSLPSASYAPTGASVAARISQVGWINPTLGATSPTGFNFGLAPGSAYQAGNSRFANGGDGKDIGLDMTQLAVHQGWVINPHVIYNSGSTAKVTFLAPDGFGCTVDWTTAADFTNMSLVTRVANSGGDRSQTVNLTGLPGASSINIRVNCAVFQPQLSFSTQ